MDPASLKHCNTSLAAPAPPEAAPAAPSQALTAAEEPSPSALGVSVGISPEQGSVLFNGMVMPFTRTTIFGAIWCKSILVLLC
jgi:hypothetical protein